MQPETPQPEPQQTPQNQPTPQQPLSTPPSEVPTAQEAPTTDTPQAQFAGMFGRRLGRTGFFLGFLYWALLLLVPVGGVVAYLFSSSGVPASFSDFYGSSTGVSLAYLFGVVAVVSLPISISLYVRRLHDLGQSCWWSILSLISPINFFFMLYLLFAKGEAEENRFGKPVSARDLPSVLGFRKPKQ